MAAITAPLTPSPLHLRPLNVLRDLPAVADLVETCFASTLDEDGHRFLQQMRRSGKDNAFMRWAAQVADTVSMPLTGYVWEQDGQIIGNASLIPYRHNKVKYYLIANVAVHPNHRRGGIGRRLTSAALEHAREKHAAEIWLHVRDDNPGAIKLYEDLSFKVHARRSSWRITSDRTSNPAAPSLPIYLRRKRDWLIQEKYLRRIHPENLDWYQSLPLASMRPGLFYSLERVLLADDTRHWVVRDGKNMTASLTWQPAPAGYPDRLWSALPEKGADEALTALLLRAQRELAFRRSTLALEMPFGEYTDAIQSAGFILQRTLIWMKWEE